MIELLKSIESLNHLSAFEASARHASFTKAAEELGVSQPAISQSVRKLEDAIGTKLFHRHHRIITLTDAGELLKHDVSQGFDRILTTVKHLRRQASGQHVTLSVSTAFANHWMVPRLQEFHQAHPDVDLRLQTTDKDLDLAQEGISLGVWRGNGNWRGYDSVQIAQESLMALASPNWMAQNGPITTIEALAGSQLINLEEPYRERPNWADFFAEFGQSFRDRGGGLRLNDYVLVLQAAMAGEGICMGWRHVTKHLLAAELLCPVGDWIWNSPSGFYLVWSKTAVLSEQACAVRDWIIAEARKTSL